MSLSIKDVLVSVNEAKQKIAVKKALVGFLRTRYMSRDGLNPQSYIQYDRSTVMEDIIHEVASELDKEIKAAELALQATLQEKING